MAENIDSQLKRMMQDMKDIISHINTSNTNLKENDDPVKTICHDIIISDYFSS